ncbi:phospholipase D-like domain-containing protein [Diaphorobacter caeni]|uniref:phospholipase D-like domain-containing protein n=1 Tax=Diaphorobacter caeni TaxID=2784387 RepID=UPI00188E1FC0|nr:phospholipase D-like domain-containing protein [Diaphorobacter caeni]MBF5007421.1 cardiolipin synthase B [Diaphorobacter caeni]
MFWTIFWTALVTLVLVIVARNFALSEKKIERRVKHLYPIRSPQFRRDMGNLLGPAIVSGNHIEALQNGDEIFPAMLEAVRGARTSICFETYIYWSGEIGEAFADALAERARLGVKVHITLDWMGSLKMDNALIERVTQAGAEVQQYRPLRWYSVDRLNNRTHRKLLIIDGTTAFTGGVGIADQWAGHAQDEEHWRDIHFRMHGPVVLQAQAAFSDNWIKTTGEVLTGEDYFPAQHRHGVADAQLFIASPAGGSESMHLMYLMAIAAATRSIDLQAAYFVPDDLIIGELIAALDRGVSVRITVPGKHIDSGTVRTASKATWGDLLERGVKIYEYLPTMMHNKMLILDAEMVSVGSTNFDVRSFRLNDEASLNIYDEVFAADMTQVFEADLQHCREYTHAMWERRSLRQRVLEWVVMAFRSQL